MGLGAVQGESVAAVGVGLKRREGSSDGHSNAGKATARTQGRSRRDAKRFKMRPGGVYAATLETQVRPVTEGINNLSNK